MPSALKRRQKDAVGPREAKVWNGFPVLFYTPLERIRNLFLGPSHLFLGAISGTGIAIYDLCQ